MLDLARVVDSHPESHAVDIVMMQGGRRMSGVQVMTPMAGTDIGWNDLPSPSMIGFDATTTQVRDILAVVAFAGHVPVVLGFLFPQVSQCLFRDKDRMVYRHASDAYVTMDKDGNTELYHPSGTYLRIGASGEHEDLTGKDYDGIWAIKKNTDAAVHVHLSVKNAGAEKCLLDIDPSGNVTLQNAGTLDATVAGNTTLTTPHVTMNTAELFVSGNIRANGTILDLASSSGRSMDSMRSVYNGHTHSDPQGGSVSPPTSSM
jgi:hypothetical protein